MLEVGLEGHSEWKKSLLISLILELKLGENSNCDVGSFL